PKREDVFILLGRQFSKKIMNNKHEYEYSKNIPELIDLLSLDNNEGVKDYYCSIPTLPDKIVSDTPYKISNAYENRIEEEIDRLIKKKIHQTIKFNLAK
ncbi:hypothetical protein NGRA_3503, partial [Nosema granulosis]